MAIAQEIESVHCESKEMCCWTHRDRFVRGRGMTLCHSDDFHPQAREDPMSGFVAMKGDHLREQSVRVFHLKRILREIKDIQKEHRRAAKRKRSERSSKSKQKKNLSR
jgi:hypothetical protein